MLFLVVRGPAIESVVDFVVIEIFHKKYGNALCLLFFPIELYII